MIKHICDHCGKELDRYDGSLMIYSCNKEAELCKECNEDFLNWLNHKPTKDYEKEIKDYEKAIHNYQQQIIDLTEKLDKTKISRDWWKNRCNGNLS